MYLTKREQRELARRVRKQTIQWALLVVAIIAACVGVISYYVVTYA
jgi:hypothetical protein